MEGLFVLGPNMIPNPDEIIRRVQAADYRPAKMKDLARLLSVEQPDYRTFRALVRQMVVQGTLVKTSGNRYAHPSLLGGEVGLLRLHRNGYGFVSIPGKDADVFVGRDEINGALDGDTVRVEINGRWSREGLPQGSIREVVVEGKKEYIGLLLRRGTQWIVEVEDASFGRDLFVDIADIPQAVEGYRVAVEIVERGQGYRGLRGAITQVLGDPNIPSLDFDTVVRQYGIPQSFSVEALEDSHRSIDWQAELERRRDMRDRVCFTIDPERARDHDDAVSVLREGEGGYRLWVHIADVSHFVPAGSALDREAYDRGTSTYLIDRVVHMLPEALAAEQCSLVPGEDRLALTVEMSLGKDGQVVDSELYESVIRSSARLSYGQVQACLDGREEEAGDAYAWQRELKCLADLSSLRRSIRNRRGSLDLDLPEPEVELDGNGVPLRVGIYPRWESNRIIEECMLVANECVGRFCAKENLPVLYRVHTPPTGDKLDSVLGLLGRGGKRMGGDPQRLTPQYFQSMLQLASSLPNASLVSKLLLRSLSRAEYKAEDGGHFGLACAQYLHFTSPIRRYPDLLVHRVLKAALNRQWGEAERSALRARIVEFGQHCSSRERRAESAERTYVKTKQMRYMERHVGDSFDGVVSGVLRSGFFVEINEVLTEGFCPMREFDEPVDFDSQHHRLVLRRSRGAIQLGMAVRVVVCAVDWMAQEMDLALTPEGNSDIFGRRGSGRSHTKGQKSRRGGRPPKRRSR